jgi:hypothetical protein
MEKNAMSQHFSNLFFLLPVSLTLLISLYFQIYSQIFVKIRNGSNRVIRDMGENCFVKKQEATNLVSCYL